MAAEIEIDIPPSSIINASRTLKSISVTSEAKKSAQLPLTISKDRVLKNADFNPSYFRTFSATEMENKHEKSKVYTLVLTGGPCGGKTTGQARLASFFESLGWKVFTVPETASVLLSGGVKFAELNPEQIYAFQKDLSFLTKRASYTIETCAIDPSAYISSEEWQKLLTECNLNMFDLRDSRYHQVVHMVTAADGASKFYTLKNNAVRSEGLGQALEQDQRTRNVWLGHPYFDIVDNADCRKFDDKILKLIQVVCDRIGLNYDDRLSTNSRKRKWLVRAVTGRFDKYEEFSVRHDYLLSDNENIQARIRSRSQNGNTTYTVTTRNCTVSNGGEPIETRMQLTFREYNRYMTMKDKSRATLNKKRRCFTYGTAYFHLDIYTPPLPPACFGSDLMILETYTTKPVGCKEPALPPYLDVVREITNEPAFSMYSLAKYGAKNMLCFTTNSGVDQNENGVLNSKKVIGSLNGTAGSLAL